MHLYCRKAQFPANSFPSLHTALSPADVWIGAAPAAPRPGEAADGSSDPCWEPHSSTIYPGHHLFFSLCVSHRLKLKHLLLAYGDQQNVKHYKVQKCQGRQATALCSRVLALLLLGPTLQKPQWNPSSQRVTGNQTATASLTTTKRHFHKAFWGRGN